MIYLYDLITDIIHKYKWEIMEEINSSDGVKLYSIRKSKNSKSKFSRLNFIIKGYRLNVLNPLKDYDYIEASVILHDPESLDYLEKILA